MQDRRKILKNIRKRWNTPEKLLEYIEELDRQEQLELELAYKRGLKETVKNYSYAVAYTLNKNWSYGKKRLPVLMKSIASTCYELEIGRLTIEDCQKKLDKIFKLE